MTLKFKLSPDILTMHLPYPPSFIIQCVIASLHYYYHHVIHTVQIKAKNRKKN